MDWVRENKRYLQPSLAPFNTASMHTTTFNELNFRLGSHYLYVHQGECKHAIIFRELRLVLVFLLFVIARSVYHLSMRWDREEGELVDS